MSAEERLANCTQVLEIMEKTGFPCYLKALEQVGVSGVTGNLGVKYIMSGRKQNKSEKFVLWERIINLCMCCNKRSKC